jgi:DNA-directed RNA polymerase subunit RPC12/RpoP
MPVDMTCASCGARIRVPRKLIGSGQPVLCPRCHQPIDFRATPVPGARPPTPTDFELGAIETTPATIACPHCGGAMQHVADLVGQVVACPHCSGQFPMPALAMPPAAVTPTSLPTGPPPPSDVINCPHCGKPITLPRTSEKPAKVKILVTRPGLTPTGPEPDHRAAVFLLPQPAIGRIPLSIRALGGDRTAFDDYCELLQGSGIYLEQIRRDGRAVFNHVPAGDYTLIVRSLLGFCRTPADREATAAILQQYFANGDATDPNTPLPPTTFKHRMVAESISLLPGDRFEHQQDF